MTANIEREIAKIEKTFLGYEAHGILTAYLHVNYGGALQGVGGYDLRPDSAVSCPGWIDRTLRACGVRSWEELKGRTIFVLTSERQVVGIMPLPTEPGEPFMFHEVGAAR